jgi:hypothetical protein
VLDDRSRLTIHNDRGADGTPYLKADPIGTKGMAESAGPVSSNDSSVIDQGKM